MLNNTAVHEGGKGKSFEYKKFTTLATKVPPLVTKAVAYIQQKFQ